MQSFLPRLSRAKEGRVFANALLKQPLWPSSYNVWQWRNQAFRYELGGGHTPSLRAAGSAGHRVIIDPGPEYNAARFASACTRA